MAKPDTEPPKSKPSTAPVAALIDYESKQKDVDGRGWLLLRLNKSRGTAIAWFPPFCCVCLKATPMKWRLPISFPILLQIPICPECRRRYEWRSRCAYLGGLLLSITCGLAVAMSCGDSRHRELTLAILCGSTFVGIAITLIVAQYLTLPIRLGFWLRWKTTLRIKFRNPAYIKILDQAQIQSENATALVLPPNALSQRARAAQQSSSHAKAQRRQED